MSLVGLLVWFTRDPEARPECDCAPNVRTGNPPLFVLATKFSLRREPIGAQRRVSRIRGNILASGSRNPPVARRTPSFLPPSFLPEQKLAALAGREVVTNYSSATAPDSHRVPSRGCELFSFAKNCREQSGRVPRSQAESPLHAYHARSMLRRFQRNSNMFPSCG